MHVGLEDRTILGAGGQSRRGRLVRQEVAEPVDDVLVSDLLDRLEHVDVVAQDEVDVG